MLLVIDIGNTSTTHGFYYRGRLQGVKYMKSDIIPLYLSKLTNKKVNIPITGALITSVVPEISVKVRRILQAKKRVKVWELGRDFRAQIRHKYNNINKLGNDRLCNIYGALKDYKLPFLILDFGTAITCDLVSSKGVFEGGLILPGPEICLQALSERTALLPKVGFPRKVQQALVGRSTEDGMQLGALQGTAALTDGLVERFKRKHGSKLKVIATGGLASAVYPLTQRIDLLDPELTLRGLVLAFLDFHENSNS